MDVCNSTVGYHQSTGQRHFELDTSADDWSDDSDSDDVQTATNAASGSGSQLNASSVVQYADNWANVNKGSRNQLMFLSLASATKSMGED